VGKNSLQGRAKGRISETHGKPRSQKREEKGGTHVTHKRKGGGGEKRAALNKREKKRLCQGKTSGKKNEGIKKGHKAGVFEKKAQKGEQKGRKKLPEPSGGGWWGKADE